MASLGHIAVGMAAARIYPDTQASPRPSVSSVLFWSALSFLPDADVIGFAMGVRYGDAWGHRGATHSFVFAVLVGAIVGAAAPFFRRPPMRTFILATLVLASHPLLDTLTDGGLGCALFWPFDLTRYFAPWTPIPVSPIGVRFFSPRGMYAASVEGKATPMPNAVQERLIRLWAGPQGAPKAALLAARQTDELGPNPSVGIQDGVTTSGQTSVTWEGGKPVVTFPIPGVPGAIATATLDAKFMAEKIVVKNGAATTEFTYSDHKDWNNPLNTIDAIYAGKITEKRNGAVARDLTTLETETGSVYVVMPVPASVKKAITPSVQVPTVGVPAARQQAAAATPRRADGKPDLTGNWAAAGMNWRYGNRRCGPTQIECTRQLNQTYDFEFEAPSRFGPNRPLYKPEHWDKIQQLDMWTNKEDPVMTCQPLGIPRHGAPRRIVQSDRDIIFFYGQYADGGGGAGEYRIIPIDGRKHDTRRAQQETYLGYTVGNWDGDTLVLDSIAFVDTTWLARGGFFHSSNMRVVEKFTRQGNEIKYEVTVEDPEVLVEPWVMTPRTMRLVANPDAGLLPERGNCEVYELEDITSQIRH